MNRPLVHAVSLCVAAWVAVGAAAAAPAAADSLVFIRDSNVWLANPDGSGQYQVTLDGTAGSAYESPSQADDGTIVAVRQPPGQRTQLFRMSQSGRLLNPPINTPAPGTGAMHPKVSPNGALVAYWFETLVNSPLCVFCVSLSNQALLTYSDRFTHHEAIGTPNTGGWPSWLGNDTIVLGNGSAELKYYRLGMSAAADWFNESVFIGGGAGLQTLLDAEVAPTGDRLAVVRGNHQETIRILGMSGPPPGADPAPLPCLYQNPTGRFVEPTWSSDGRLLAWQEDDGVWLGDPGDPSCPDGPGSSCPAPASPTSVPPRSTPARARCAGTPATRSRVACPTRGSAIRAPGRTRRSTLRPFAGRSAGSRRT